MSLFCCFIGCSGSDDSNGGGSENQSTVSYIIDGNVTNDYDYIDNRITFIRNTFEYLPDDEQNAMTIRVHEYQDIIGIESLDYRTSNDFSNSIYIRITNSGIGTYSFNSETESSPMYIRITTRDGNTYKSSISDAGKMLSVTISESTENRLVGTFTATLNAYYEENGALYYNQELSEGGQFYVNGEFDLVKL